MGMGFHQPRWQADNIGFGGVPQAGRLSLDEAVKTISHLPISSLTTELRIRLDPLSGEDFLFNGSTGVGKSIGIPILAATHDVDRVDVHVPTRGAAEGLATYASQLLGFPVGTFVGFRAGDVKAVTYPDEATPERPATKILYSTYGTAAGPEFSGRGLPASRIILLDEIQYPGEEKQIALAGIMRQREMGLELRVVPMSATCDSEEITRFFNVPELSLDISRYPITDLTPGTSPVEDAAKLMLRGLSPLVFREGAADCHDMIEAVQGLLGSRANQFDYFPYYSWVDSSIKRQVHSPEYKRPTLIAATDAVQQAVTLPIDAVLNNGWVKRQSGSDGVMQLIREPTSLAEDIQRRGRLGRLPDKKAFYIYYGPNENKAKYPVPDSHRYPPLRLSLAFSELGEKPSDATDLLMNPPLPHLGEQADKILRKIGAIGEDGFITEKGLSLRALPLQPDTAVIVLAAEQFARERNYSEKQVLEAKCAAAKMASLLEYGPPISRSKEARQTRNWQALTGRETKSLLISFAKLTDQAIHMTDYYLKRHDLRPSHVSSLRTHWKMVHQALGTEIAPTSWTSELEELLLDSLFVARGARVRLYQDRGRVLREGGGDQVAKLGKDMRLKFDPNAEILLGQPRDVKETRYVEMASAYPVSRMIQREQIAKTAEVFSEPTYSPFGAQSRVTERFSDGELIIDILKGSEAFDWSDLNPDQRRSWIVDAVSFSPRVAPMGFRAPVDNLLLRWRGGEEQRHLLEQELSNLDYSSPPTEIREALGAIVPNGEFAGKSPYDLANGNSIPDGFSASKLEELKRTWNRTTLRIGSELGREFLTLLGVKDIRGFIRASGDELRSAIPWEFRKVAALSVLAIHTDRFSAKLDSEQVYRAGVELDPFGAQPADAYTRAVIRNIRNGKTGISQNERLKAQVDGIAVCQRMIESVYDLNEGATKDAAQKLQKGEDGIYLSDFMLGAGVLALEVVSSGADVKPSIRSHYREYASVLSQNAFALVGEQGIPSLSRLLALTPKLDEDQKRMAGVGAHLKARAILLEGNQSEAMGFIGVATQLNGQDRIARSLFQELLRK